MATNNSINLNQNGIPIYDSTLAEFSAVELAKGQLLVYDDDADEYVSLPAGAPGQVLESSDSTDTGFLWATPPTPTADLHTARYIVSAGGAADGANYTTLEAAYAAAVAATGKQTVFVQPGTYTLASDITLSPNVNISAYTCDASNGRVESFPSLNVEIIGKLTFSGSGNVSISGVCLEEDGDYFLEVTGNNSNVTLVNCYLKHSDHVGINHTSASTASKVCLVNCASMSLAQPLFANSGTGQLELWGLKCVVPIGSTGPITSTVSGTLKVYYSDIRFQISCSGTFIANHSIFDTTGYDVPFSACIFSGSQSADFSNCLINTGNDVPLVNNSSGSLKLSGCIIRRAGGTGTSISGTGTVTASNLSLEAGRMTAAQIPSLSFNDALMIATPGAYPYSVEGQDAVVLVDSSSARTITLMSAPARGQKHFVKDAAGMATINNITVDGNGKNIDGSATIVLAMSYASVEVVYNGTEWSIIG